MGYKTSTHAALSCLRIDWHSQLGVVVYTFNPSILDPEAGGSKIQG
jgi:hypothetical protein